ncbi:hypothetical protein DFP92_11356 [Yoonia sediminilitoris]|uniref:Uncharacterized protein n=1 Tax=Yoonia sediminilitoris TaxID=1286148 RepID=A0A2T6K9W9_9RHOB|nr:hypothetical protein C8N45_11356 [Yoonia sediminilitoris]RCW91739.1 hypothetical protein DFP92_11356 [Yoonia sediminilitoris]
MHYQRVAKNIPVVLSAEEVARIFEATVQLRFWDGLWLCRDLEALQCPSSIAYQFLNRIFQVFRHHHDVDRAYIAPHLSP